MSANPQTGTTVQLLDLEEGLAGNLQYLTSICDSEFNFHRHDKRCRGGLSFRANTAVEVGRGKVNNSRRPLIPLIWTGPVLLLQEQVSWKILVKCRRCNLSFVAEHSGRLRFLLRGGHFAFPFSPKRALFEPESRICRLARLVGSTRVLGVRC